MTGQFEDVLALMRLQLLALAPDAVGTKVPNPRPSGPFIRLMDAGGDIDGPTAWVMISVECWNTSKKLARDLAHDVQAAISEWAESGDVISHAELGWPVDNPDPDSTNPRYTFVARCFTIAL